MNLRLDANAKSRTFFALKRQVFMLVARPFSAASASAWVTMTTGAFAVRALARRSRWAAVKTSPGFCSSPVEATMWSAGTVSATS